MQKCGIFLFILSQPSVKSGIEPELMAKRVSNGMKEVYKMHLSELANAYFRKMALVLPIGKRLADLLQYAELQNSRLLGIKKYETLPPSEEAIEHWRKVVLG
jgi:hypothetical protein